jgi:type VI secretion system ImpB/VipA family protein
MTEKRSGGIASFGVSFGDRKDKPQEGGGEPEEQPLRIAVVAELVPGPDWSAGRIPPIEPIRIDAESFDTVMGQLAPSLALDVDDPFGGGEAPLRIDLVLRDRKAMRPNEIAQQVPALRALVDARRIVQDVAGRKLSADAARAQLARILPRASWADALVSEVRTAPAVEPAPPAAPSAARPQGSAATAPGSSASGGGNGATGGLDALLGMVDVAEPAPISAEPAVTQSDFSRVVAAVARSARPNAYPRALVGTAPQRLEQAFRNLLGAVVLHPEFRRLEGTWRGLRLLVEHCDRKAGVEVDVVCAGRDAVSDALRRLGEGDADRAPVDLVVIDQRVEPTAADLGRLERWAGFAETLLCPIVVAGQAAMVGVDSLERLARSTSALASSDDPRAVAVRAIAAHEATRWVTLVLNDPLVRTPYTQATSRQQQPPFEEQPHDPDAHVFTNGAYVVAALCAKSYARLGWPTAITGARDGLLGDLPVHTVHDRGVDAAIPLEVTPTEDAVREVAKAGLTLLTCSPNSDAAILARAPVLHRSGGGNGPSAGTLADQLFVGRFARAVQQVAGAIPAGTTPQAAEEVACIALSELFGRAPPAGPEISAKVDPVRNALTVTVRPRRFAGIGLEELTLGSALG